MNVLYALRRARDFHSAKIAIFDEDRAVTYGEFHTRLVRVANALHDLGLGRGDRLAILMLNSPRYLELYYAAAMAGIVVVPINTRWNEDDVAATVRDAGAAMIAVDDRFAAMKIDGAVTLGPSEYERAVAAAGAQELAGPEPDDGDIVGLFYTSGTTGGSKGAMLTHRNLCANMNTMLVTRCVPEGTWLHAAPMFHLADAAILWAAPMMGLAHAFLATFDPEAFLRTVARYHVSSTVLVPAMINMVVNHPAMDRYDTSSLEVLFYGASPMPREILRRAKEKLRCDFAQAYGMTEASPVLTILMPEEHVLDSAAIRSAGRPVPCAEVRIVDPMDRELPRGQEGEIVARGDMIMKGYWNRPEITAQALRGGWYHSGDVGVMDENGYVYVLDRLKDMIKPGGENVYSPEVESEIAGHPAVLEVAVIGVPDEKWGEAIKAVVVLRPGATLAAGELIAWCRERMTHFKCPSSVEFTDDLPKGGTGKLLKHVLRKRYGLKTASAG